MMRLLVLLVIASLCSACGWQLRGSTPVSSTLQSLYLTAEDAYNPVTQELKELLAIHGVALASEPEAANLRLHIENEISDRRTAAVGVDALTSAYEIFLKVRYDMRAPDNRPVTSLGSATVTRIFNYSADSASSGAQEEALLLEEMRREMAQILLRRLSAMSAHIQEQGF